MGTLLCVSIMVDSIDEALRDAEQARALGADLVEWRVDRLFNGVAAIGEVERLVEASPLACIVTCRPAFEGGEYDGDDDERVALYEHLGTAETPPRYIDCELATYTRSDNIRRKVDLGIDHPGQLREVATSLILSVHDFETRPTDLTRRLLAMRAESSAKVLKIAFRARSLRDNTELLDLLADRDRPTIALGMGEFGLMSRVLAPKFGGFLTFAGLRETSVTAPGQPTLPDLVGLYRFGSIGPATRVYGVVGWPVGHSIGPHVHNAGFEAIGHDGVYLPLPVPGGDGDGGYESFKATVGELADHPRLSLAGLSVTLPHKTHLVRLARERGWPLDRASEAIGAANTLVIARIDDGSIADARVANTDVGAGVESLVDRMGASGLRRVGVIGAGGVARALVFGLMEAGAEVQVFNRSERGAALAGEMNEQHGATTQWRVVAHTLGAITESACDAYVNCTPVGMAGGPDPGGMPVDPGALRGVPAHAVFFDTVYNPIETPMLAAARKAGYRTVDGVTMFVRQAGAQFRLWTGDSAPTGLFDRVAREVLAAGET
jgi:3-dehydroquinate dehydratase/shikimate dehydrogenase